MPSPLTIWRAFLALPNAHPVKTIGVAVLVALTSSLLVSVTAVTLKPLQDANKLGERAATLLALTETLGLGAPKARLVDLASGDYALRDDGAVTALPPDRDVAGLGSRENVAEVYELYQDGRLALVVLPVRGTGYKSTIKGYLALQGDLNTIAALKIYEQDESPGLGSRISEDAWAALWPGKLVADANGVIRIEVVKGAGEGLFEVDGISGATRTGDGVTNLVRFWLGADGFAPYLDRLKRESTS